MGMKRCPICGEKFADTYKRCPFCEEDENPRRARQPKRYEGGGRRLARRNYEEDLPRPMYGEDEPAAPPRRRRAERCDDGDDYPEDEAYEGRRARRGRYEDDDPYYDDDDRGSPWFKIVMAVLIVIIIACLLYLGRGVIGTLLPDGNNTPPSSMSSTEEPEEDEDSPGLADPDEGMEPQVDDPDTPEEDEENDPGSTVRPGEDDEQDEPDTSVTGGALTLSHTDVSIAGDESFTLSARSGSGDVTYTSKDPAIASVSASGVVTGVKKGTTEITVRRGSASAVCIVRVKSDGAGAASSGGASSAAASLNRTDMTLSAGETFQLRVSGITTKITWSSADAGVATVSGNGTVTGVGSGTTRVTASWDGHQASCIVRVR